jgi:hypothetical protein
MPKKQALYYKNRPLLLTKLSYIKKWINKILNKGFICELILLATVLLFLTTKPGGSVQIYYNY